MVCIPGHFFNIPYNSTQYPGNPSLKELSAGANCQQFAYELVRYHGKEIPDFRSSDLWEDYNYTIRVDKLQPLDILLWNHTQQAWGAHVGVYLGDNQAIHLSKQVGKPVIWTLEQFSQIPTYQYFIGAKRIISR